MLGREPPDHAVERRRWNPDLVPAHEVGAVHARVDDVAEGRSDQEFRRRVVAHLIAATWCQGTVFQALIEFTRNP